VLELTRDPAVGPSDAGTGGNPGDLPEHGIRPGDIVRVGPQPKGGERKKEKAGLEGKGVDGVVVRTTRAGVQVAVDADDDVEGRLWV
jgi:DNA polymerase alpha-associated DNA helicase A